MTDVYTFKVMTLYSSDGIIKSFDVMVDMADRDVVLAEAWHMNKCYVSASVLGIHHSNRVAISLHRLLMGNPKGLAVHHVNGNKLDNRRSNLKIMTHGDHMRLHATQRAEVKRLPPHPPCHHQREAWQAHDYEGAAGDNADGEEEK